MTLDVQGDQEFEALRHKLLKWASDAPAELKLVLSQASELVRREVQEGHLSGPKMPRGVGDPDVATLAVQTGTLRRSISQRVAVAMDQVSAEIGTNVEHKGFPYGRAHELGEGGMPGRPFLAPSVRKLRPNIFQMIREAFFRTYK